MQIQGALTCDVHFVFEKIAHAEVIGLRDTDTLISHCQKRSNLSTCAMQNRIIFEVDKVERPNRKYINRSIKFIRSKFDGSIYRSLSLSNLGCGINITF